VRASTRVTERYGFVLDCFAYRHRAERFCGNSYSKVTSVTCVCKVMQALGLIIGHSFVAGVIAHDIGDSLQNTLSFVGHRDAVCLCVCACARLSNRQDVFRSECSGNVKKEP